MSIGAIPIPPAAIPPVDPVAELPPVAPIAPLPGGNLTPEQLATAATVPLNPAASPLDAELAKLPPSAAPLPPEPKTPEEAAARNASTATAIGEEKVKNAEEKAANDVKTAEARKTYVDDFAKASQAILDRQEQQRQAAEQAVTVARNKAESEPYHTLWETRSIGQKVAIAFGLLVGGVSWNENHVNRGAAMLEAATKQDFELQKQKHADLWRAVNEAEQGTKILDANQLRDLSAFNASQGAKWDRISSELGALIAANKGRSDVTEAKKVALDAVEKSNTFWQNSVTAAATARHQEAMDKERALHDREIEKAKRAKAAGGGGGSSAVDAAAVKLREEIEAAQTSGKPLTGAQIDRRAFELKIPPVAKAGRTSVKTILDKIKEQGAINKDITIGDKDANLIIYDPQTKEPVAKAGSVREKAALSKQDVQYGDAARRVKELADDIRQNGATVTTPEAIQRRSARYANAIIGVAVTSPLGKTNESIHQEAASLGLSGAIDPDHLAGSIAKLLSGFTARVETVDHKEHEMKRLRQEFRNTVPITDEEKKKYSKRGGESGGEGKKWVEIPSRLAGEPEANGKKEMLVSASGKFLGEFR